MDPGLDGVRSKERDISRQHKIRIEVCHNVHADNEIGIERLGSQLRLLNNQVRTYKHDEHDIVLWLVLLDGPQLKISRDTTTH
jgi:hypothetical protein